VARRAAASYGLTPPTFGVQPFRLLSTNIQAISSFERRGLKPPENKVYWFFVLVFICVTEGLLV
jgi:hypothetical protein